MNINPSLYNGSTPLRIAALRGHLKICKLIIDGLQNKNPENIINMTPLHFAAKYGHMDVCELILENVQNKTPETQDGTTPAMLAIENNHCELGQLLNNAGMAKVDEHLGTQFVRDEKPRKLNKSQ